MIQTISGTCDTTNEKTSKCVFFLVLLNYKKIKKMAQKMSFYTVITLPSMSEPHTCFFYNLARIDSDSFNKSSIEGLFLATGSKHLVISSVDSGDPRVHSNFPSTIS